MNNPVNKCLAIMSLGVAALLTGCADEGVGLTRPDDSVGIPITLAGTIVQETGARVNDDGFADGDMIGVYIVDYTGDEPGALLNSGNRGDNVRHTFDEANYKWTSAYDLYWKDKATKIDVYGYYPYSAPDDVRNYTFAIKTNQARVPADGTMGDYEASDLLWGKVAAVAPTDRVISIPFAHRMANARVTLLQGEGFTDGEWTDLDKQVLVTNTVQQAAVDLADGSVKANGPVARNAIIPAKQGDEWRAIVVPQQIAAGTTMFSITLGGIPYKFAKDEDFAYVSGKMSNFAIKVDKKNASGDFTLTLVSESITAWESDLVSHDGQTKEYVVVESTPGGLKEAIVADGKDYMQLKNLKITGEIDSRDFEFMRGEMANLQCLNLKETKIAAYDGNEAERIPNGAMSNKTSLIRLVLPDKLKAIGFSAFEDCNNLSGSLIIPEGVTTLDGKCFNDCQSLTGMLSLPSTLKEIGHGAFQDCGFVCEISIPDGVEKIGYYAFSGCSGLYGSLRLPKNLKKIENYTFFNCRNLTGSLEIPESVIDIEHHAFTQCQGLKGNLILHDNIQSIGNNAFYFCRFRGELHLPANLVTLEDNTFGYCDFSGTLALPKSLQSIGKECFYVNNISGVLEFPEGFTSIGVSAFAGCSLLEGLVLPASLDNIRESAFNGCYGIGSIVCNGTMPAYVMSSAFNGVPKDNFTLEVPEAAVVQYQTAQGWSDFKRIAAHHELVCRPAVACALSSERRQTLVLNAEGDWEVASLPDWCELSQTSGSKKSELTLTIKAMAASDGQREGDVVFRLKGKDYTHSCHVTQYGYQYSEDEYLTLQQATRGNRGGINIVLLGDGYDAKDISSGDYLSDIRMAMEHFFGLEPYATYRDYFNVYTAFPLSTESGIGTVNTIRYNRFETTFTGGVVLKCDYDEVFRYALNAPTVNEGNLNETLIIIIPNTDEYGGVTNLWADGSAIAFCPKSADSFPFDARGIIQHEAGGHGFGKLGDEYIYHNAFIDACGCSCCKHAESLLSGKSLGWFDNLEITGKMQQVGWSHLIFDPRYSDIVDVFEGGYFHTRGVFRSEQNSCMNNNIPYYSTISRESIVKRIKRYAGETYSFEEFVANDKRGAAQAARSRGTLLIQGASSYQSMPPVIHNGSPLQSMKRNRPKHK